MVRRTYYLPRDVVAELDRAVVQAQASAYVERAPDKSVVIAAVLRAGLAAMPAVIDELRSGGANTEPGSAGKTRQRGWQRPVAVPRQLQELRGPTSGSVGLPVSVHSSGLGPDEKFDLDHESARIAMYEILLTEGRLDDLRRFVDASELTRLWSRLWLPTYVRNAWQRRYPELAA